VLEPGWRAQMNPLGHLLLERVQALPRRSAVGTEVDPVMLEVFNNLFMSIAEQMGVALRNTAYSVNIKERLDFSCALFDAQGRLIANAPHVPVHLGSMGASVQAVMACRGGRMQPGDVFMLNNPYAGGTHLPDVTVVTPVFGAAGKLLFFVASRGHHGDIGGITPGSMPPQSRRIEEEGVLIDDFQLVAEGELREAAVRELLGAGPHPVRNIEQNLSDLKAQIAANEKGARELRRLVEQYGLEVVQAYMEHVRANAEEQVRRVLGVLRPGRFVQPLDNGAEIRVEIGIDAARRRAVIDFAGTSAQLESNFNAPEAVVRAAVLYVFRTLVEDEIPLNDGCLAPLDIRVPAGSMLNPRYPAAVAAGNVETSQAVVNALYGALGVLAAAQGTMNNLTFGNADYQYYETICGGAGAGPEFDGASAVQTHMTNSRLTDPEVLESRFPVLLRRFELRRGSGGSGLRRGGDGVIRALQFRQPMTAALLANNHRHRPFGLVGGGSGAAGQARIERADGGVESLSATGQTEMRPGDVLVIETPGGGGFGSAG
jgi:5-oxoprolinase (ATP-hydrolysing)